MATEDSRATSSRASPSRERFRRGRLGASRRRSRLTDDLTARKRKEVVERIERHPFAERITPRDVRRLPIDGAQPVIEHGEEARVLELAHTLFTPSLATDARRILKHYNIIALPCRPYAPDLKGKIESQVSYAQGTALKGKRFELIDDQNAHLVHWDERWASTRIHGTTKRQVREMFEEERPALKPLPAARFEYYRIVERRVAFDGHIEVDGAYYSSPSRYVGTTVIVHAGRFFIRLIDPINHQLFREHPVTGKGMRRTVEADLPKQTPPQVEKLVARIATLGQSCGKFARSLETERGALALRSLFGVLDLARKYGPEALERACTMANAANSSRYRFLRTYLQHHAQLKPLAERNRIIGNINTYVDHVKTLTKSQQGELFDDRR